MGTFQIERFGPRSPAAPVLGYQGETELIARWQAEYKVPIFTSGTNHVRALKALNVKRFVGATYFPGEINELFARYFTQAGFDVLGMDGISVPFDKVGSLSAQFTAAPFNVHPVPPPSAGLRGFCVGKLLEKVPPVR